RASRILFCQSAIPRGGLSPERLPDELWRLTREPSCSRRGRGPAPAPPPCQGRWRAPGRLRPPAERAHGSHAPPERGRRDVSRACPRQTIDGPRNGRLGLSQATECIGQGPTLGTVDPAAAVAAGSSLGSMLVGADAVRWTPAPRTERALEHAREQRSEPGLGGP